MQAGLASGHGWCPIDPLTFESLLVAGVHVIGDACIADPMPKAASAANAQARQCALAIAAALDGREPAAPLLESVCYSMLAQRRALSIHGRFQLVDGAIRAVQRSDGPGSRLRVPSRKPGTRSTGTQVWWQRPSEPNSLVKKVPTRQEWGEGRGEGYPFPFHQDL